jgi:hypothetical protein
MRVIASLMISGQIRTGVSVRGAKIIAGELPPLRPYGRKLIPLSSGATHAQRRKAAHRLLAERYNWCTQGFGSADHQEARALLAPLGR